MNKPVYAYEEIPLIIPGLYDPNRNSYSVLIGDNGAGKSRLLSNISSMLAQKAKHRPDSAYTWRFNTNVRLDGMPKVITVSTSPFDTFKLPKSDSPYDPENSNYRYIGMRGAGSMSSGSITLISSAAVGLLDKLQYKQELKKLARVFQVLNFEPSMDFIFKPLFQDPSLIPRNSGEFDFGTNVPAVKYIESRHSIKFDAKASMALAQLPEEELDNIINALDNYAYFYLDRKHFTLSVNYDHTWSYSFNKEMRDDGHLLACTLTLLRHGLLKLMDLRLAKHDNYDFSLRRASSGQQCLLVIMLGIAGHITDGSQIFIDEPEISLHPKWQERFMSLLIEVFSDYSRCNFYIATHSPQVVSKLSARNCFITSLSRQEIYDAEEFREKSADYQLAEIFDAPGSMNEYIVRLAFKSMSSMRSRDRITDETNKDLMKLLKFSDGLETSDPLFQLIDSALKMGDRYASHY